VVIPFERLQGKYEILEKLQEGGMGSVYKVRHRLLEEVRVIKVMRPHLADDDVLRERFFREAKIAIRLRHRNLAQFYDFTMDEDGTAFIVMEFIDGVNLQDLLAASQRPALALTLELACQTLEVLGYLHRKSIVHRDIAPDNLILTRDEDGDPLVKLIDLGIAKVHEGSSGLTKTGTFIGKIRYCSPEHFRTHEGAEVDARSDLYSFGIVLYELATGTYPIRGKSTSGLIAGHLVKAPIEFSKSDPDGLVPDDLRAAILRVLSKQQEDRFADAQSFRKELLEVKKRYPLDEQELSRALASPVLEQMPRKRPGSTQDRMDRHFGLTTTPPHGSEAGPLPVEPPPLPVDVQPEPPPPHPAMEEGERTTEVGAAMQAARKRALALEQQVKALLLGAEKLVELHHYDEARIQLQTALELDPNQHEAQRLLAAVNAADAKRRAKRVQAAKEIADLLASGDLDRAAGSLETATDRLGDGTEFEDLRSRLEQAAELEEARARRVGERLATARALLDEGGFEEAIEALQQALDSDPRNAEARQLLERAQSAHDKLQEVRRREEEIAKVRATIVAHLDRSDLDEAERAIALARKVHGTEASFDDLGVRLLDLHKRQRAARAAALRREAGALLNERRFAQAIARLEDSLLLEPDDAEAEEILATARLLLQQHEEEERRELEIAVRTEAIERLILAGRLETAVHQVDSAVDEFGDFDDASALRDRIASEVAALRELEKRVRALLEATVESAGAGDAEAARKALSEARREAAEAPELDELVDQTEVEILEQAEARRREREIANAVASVERSLSQGDLDEAERELGVAMRLCGQAEVFAALQGRIGAARTEQRRARVEELLRQALGKQASFTEVIAKLEEALRIEPDNLRVQHLLAETRGALHRYEQQKRMAVIAEALADIDGLIAAGSFDAALDALDEAERKHGSFREARALRHSLTRAIKER